jgi:hypothetical protein
LHHHGQAAGFAVGVFDRVVDGDDVGVTQLGNGYGLASEPFGDNRSLTATCLERATSVASQTSAMPPCASLRSSWYRWASIVAEMGGGLAAPGMVADMSERKR